MSSKSSRHESIHPNSAAPNSGRLDPASSLSAEKSGCLKYILIGVLVILLIISALAGDGESNSAGKAVDLAVTLTQAEANIVTSGAGVAYSNSEAGNLLASKFSRLSEAAALEGTDTVKDNHNFIVHCQLDDDSTLFLRHVPNVPTFKKESKKRFCEIGWAIALQVLAESEVKSGSKLAVGVKRLALYQNIYFGKYEITNLLEESMGITRKSKEKSELETFFQKAPKQ